MLEQKNLGNVWVEIEMLSPAIVICLDSKVLVC